MLDHQKIVRDLHNDGYSVVERYIEPDLIEKMRAEIAQLNKVVPGRYAQYPSRCAYYPVALTRRGQHRLATTISSIVARQDFDRIASGYFGEPALVQGITNIESPKSDTPIIDWHADQSVPALEEKVVPRLKFFTYLVDVATTNGAFAVIPGTNKLVDFLRTEMLAGRIPKERLRTCTTIIRVAQENRDKIPAELHSSLDLAAEHIHSDFERTDHFDFCLPAGSVIIFDEEIIHQGGLVSEGHRSIIRYDYLPRSYYSRPELRINRLARAILRLLVAEPTKSLM